MSSSIHKADISEALQEQVRAAFDSGTALLIAGNGTKEFYGHRVQGQPLEISAHSGILYYDPSELVVTARAGTPVAALDALLHDNGQMLAFEPCSFGGRATLGGTIACNVSGPRRMFHGAARDFVLGCRMLNGRGELLRFGGEVIKNVAGYDVSRLMAGAQGTLGVLLDISLKVLPRPEAEMTLVYEMAAEQAIDTLHRWLRQPYPLSASCFDGQTLWVRLSGAQAALENAYKRLGGVPLDRGEAFWRSLNERQHEFFRQVGSLWRLSVPADCRPLPLPGKWLYEWNGAQRWLISPAPAAEIRRQAGAVSGHAMLYRAEHDSIDAVFQSLDPGLMHFHRRLKQAFDPRRILNPGRIYQDL